MPLPVGKRALAVRACLISQLYEWKWFWNGSGFGMEGAPRSCLSAPEAALGLLVSQVPIYLGGPARSKFCNLGISPEFFWDDNTKTDNSAPPSESTPKSNLQYNLPPSRIPFCPVAPESTSPLSTSACQQPGPALEDGRCCNQKLHRCNPRNRP